MTEAGFYQQTRFSPIGMATVVLLHGVALTALLMAKGDFVQRIIHPPTVVEFIRQPEVPPIKTPPTRQKTAQTHIDVTNPIVPPVSRGPVIPETPLRPTPTLPSGPVIAETIDLPAVQPPPRRTFEPARARANLGSYVSDADYPDSASRNGEQGTTRFRLSVGADGRVTDCTVTGSSGSSALDAATCRLMTKRARFTPARDSNGNPAADNVASAIRWVLPAG